MSEDKLNKFKTRIQENEGYAGKPGVEVIKLGTSDHGAYVGHGTGKRILDAYTSAGVSKEEAVIDGKNLYGKEIVVGFGHMLTQDNLKKYFTDPKTREYYNTLSKKKAEDLFEIDFEKHKKEAQKVTESHLPWNKLKPGQKEALIEMTFQLGAGADGIPDFTKMWEAIKAGDSTKAAYEILNSKMGLHQSSKRSMQYAKNMDPSLKFLELAKSLEKKGGKHFKEALAKELKDYSPTSTMKPDPTMLADPEAPSQELLDILAEEELQEREALGGMPDPSGSFRNADPIVTPDLEKEQSDILNLTDEPVMKAGLSFSSLGVEPDEVVKDDDNAVSFSSLGIEPDEVTAPATPVTATTSAEPPTPETATPSQPFEPEFQPGPDSSFLPNFQTPGEKSPSKSSVPFIAGAADTLSFGLPQKFRGLGSWLGLFNTKAKPFTGEAFIEGEQRYVEAYEDIRKDNEAGMLTGELLGALLPASIALKAGNLAKKGKLATDIGKASVTGAAEGGVYGFGKSQGETLSQVAADTLVGAGLGGAAGGGLTAFGKGAGALLRNIGDPEDKAKVIARGLRDDASIDVALKQAEDKALFNARANIEQVDLVKKLFNKAKLKGKKTIKDDFVDIMAARGTPNQTVGNWKKSLTKEGINPLSYISYTQNKVQARTRKIAKKFNMNPKELQAYYNWRYDMYNYMEYVNSSAKRFDKKPVDYKKSAIPFGPKAKSKPSTDRMSWEKAVPDDPFKQEMKSFKANIDAGLVSPESYNEYKMQQYISDAMIDIQQAKYAELLGGELIDDKLSKAVNAEVKKQFADDPLRNTIFRKMTAVHNAAEVVDHKAGTSLTKITNDLYGAEKLKSGFTTQIYDMSEELKGLRRSSQYARLSDEQLVQNIEAGKQGPLEDSFREVYKRIREAANENGVNIQEFRFGQDKYVPMKRKSGADFILALEDKFKELEPQLNDINPKTLANVLRNENYVTPTKITGADPIIQDVLHLKRFLSQNTGMPVESFDMMKRAIGNLRKEENIKAILSPSVRAVHERHGDIPMWARETNLEKMLFLDANSIADLIYKRPILDKLDTQVFLLKQKGFDKASEYFNNLKFDIMGIPRDATKHRQFKSVLRQLEKSDTTVGKLQLGLENAVTTALYPNYLGFNVRALARNLTQPYTMTTRELGVGLKGDLLAVNATRKMLAEGLDKAQKRYYKMGLLDIRDPKLQDFEGVRSGLSEYFKGKKWARNLEHGINVYSDAAMKMYSKTDTINRLITAQMSEDIAKIVKSGKTDWVKNAPQQVRNQIQDILDAGGDQDELTKAIGKWLQVKTQLNYSKDDMYELGRELGPLFSMLSKWPTAVTGDIAAKVMIEGRAGATKAATKYLGPLALASLLQNVANQEVDPNSTQSKEMFGYGGLPTWAPGPSVFGITDAVLPIPITSVLDQAQGVTELGGKALSGSWEDKDTRLLQRNAKRLMEQFVPVAGGISRSVRHIKGITGAVDKEEQNKKDMKRLQKILEN